jgi:hypothetical protein
LSKQDFGRMGKRGSTNPRTWHTVSGAPVYPAENDLWFPEEYAYIQYVKKDSNYDHNSNTSMTSDPHITFTLPADGVFEITLHGATSGPTGADIKFDWAVTGGVAQLTTRACYGPAQSMTAGEDTNMRTTKHNLTTDVPYGTETGTTSDIQEHFLVETSGGAGTITLRHAQNSSNAGTTRVSTNSYCTCRQVGGTKSSIMKYDAGWNRIL